MTATTEDVVPIREVSRATGVNSITLRAWERRYGLLKPQRTASGHRLYTQADIQRVKDIQAWLVRGLAVSQVKEILAHKEPPDVSGLTEQNPWPVYLDRAEEAVARLDAAAMEALLHEATRLYPAPLVADQLVTPLLERLGLRRGYGAQTRLAFLHSVVQEYFWFGINRQRSTATASMVLLIKLNPDDSDLLPLMATYALLNRGIKARFMGHLPSAEVTFAAERCQAAALVAHGDMAAGVSGLGRQLREWQELLHVPVFLSGKVVPVYTASGPGELKEVHAMEFQQMLVAAVADRCG